MMLKNKNSKNIDTFSANSLKVLEKSVDEFIDIYEYWLRLFKTDGRAKLGQNYHSLLCAYIKGFDIEKMKRELEEDKIKKFDRFCSKLDRKGFIKTEYSFLVKEYLKDRPYYLTGRFDAVYKTENEYIIYDWKTLNLPRDIQNDLQSVVYLYAASAIFKTKNVRVRYVSIEAEENNFSDVVYRECLKERIEGIIAKYYGSGSVN